MANFAANFRNLRKERGLTRQELADRLGISKSAVNMYERGDRRPNFEITEAITDFFGVDLNYLIGTHKDDDVTDQGGATVLLSAEERDLIRAYRSAIDDIRAAARAVLRVE